MVFRSVYGCGFSITETAEGAFKSLFKLRQLFIGELFAAFTAAA